MTKQPPRLQLLGSRVGMASPWLAPHDVLPSMQGRTSRTGLRRFASLLPKGQDRALRLVAIYALKKGSGNKKESTGGCGFLVFFVAKRARTAGIRMERIFETNFARCVLPMKAKDKRAVHWA